jgi:hypothetical protein
MSNGLQSCIDWFGPRPKFVDIITGKYACELNGGFAQVK